MDVHGELLRLLPRSSKRSCGTLGHPPDDCDGSETNCDNRDGLVFESRDQP